MTSSRKTPTQKAIEQAVDAAAERLAGTAITDCQFYGVKWDAKAIEAVQTLAEALHEQAKANASNAVAMADLVSVFRAQNVEIEAMLRLDTK